MAIEIEAALRFAGPEPSPMGPRYAVVFLRTLVAERAGKIAVRRAGVDLNGSWMSGDGIRRARGPHEKDGAAYSSTVLSG